MNSTILLWDYCGFHQQYRLNGLRILSINVPSNMHLRNFHNDIHPRDNAAKDCKDRVKPCSQSVDYVVAVVCYVDEELACCRVRLAGFRHRYGACNVAVVEPYFIWDRWYIDDLVLSTLNHEACNDAVEDCAIVETQSNQVQEVPSCQWLVIPHQKGYVAH